MAPLWLSDRTTVVLKIFGIWVEVVFVHAMRVYGEVEV